MPRQSNPISMNIRIKNVQGFEIFFGRGAYLYNSTSAGKIGRIKTWPAVSIALGSIFAAFAKNFLGKCLILPSQTVYFVPT